MQTSTSFETADHTREVNWDVLISLYKTQKLTQRAFCEKHQVPLSTFNYHLRKSRSGAPATSGSEAQPVQFLEIPPDLFSPPSQEIPAFLAASLMERLCLSRNSFNNSPKVILFLL